MSGTKQTAIIVGSVAGGVVGGYILLKIGKMAWDRYKNATVSNPVFYPKSAYGIDTIEPVEEIQISTQHKTTNVLVVEESEENEEDNQSATAPSRWQKQPSAQLGGSSQKNKKHKRRTRRRTRRHHQK